MGKYGFLEKNCLVEPKKTISLFLTISCTFRFVRFLDIARVRSYQALESIQLFTQHTFARKKCLFQSMKIQKLVIFSWRFSSEKCPTLTVASFFLLFSSDYNLTLIGPHFLQSKLLKLLP